jgi:hypothetical protein
MLDVESLRGNGRERELHEESRRLRVPATNPVSFARRRAWFAGNARGPWWGRRTSRAPLWGKHRDLVVAAFWEMSARVQQPTQRALGCLQCGSWRLVGVGSCRNQMARSPNDAGRSTRKKKKKN